MTYAAIAVAAVGAVSTIASVASGGNKQTSSSSSQLEFPDETRRLFQDVEEPILSGSLNEQSSLLQPFLGGFKPGQAKEAGFGGLKDIVQGATRKGGQTAGVNDLGPIFEDTAGLPPALINALRSLVLQRGASLNSVVPAGYGQFLSPSTFTQSTQAGPSAFDSGFQIAGSLANVAGAYYGKAG
jgi:hypothetical protein